MSAITLIRRLAGGIACMATIVLALGRGLVQRLRA